MSLSSDGATSPGLPQRRADQAINPVIRMRQRCFPRADNSKVAVPASLVKGDSNAKLSSGNHRLHVGGAALRAIHHKSLALCHYPIRSIEQVTSKIVINKLRYLSRPGRDPRLGVQYNPAIRVNWRSTGSCCRDAAPIPFLLLAFRTRLPRRLRRRPARLSWGRSSS